MEYTVFRDALCEESSYPVSRQIVDYIIEKGKKIVLGKDEILIGYDEMDDSIYFILDGIIRGTVINSNGVERTVGFGLCGTMLFSAQCFSMGNPSIYRYQTCCESTVLKISKTEFDRHLAEDHEFCQWVLGAFSLALGYRELRSEGMNGDALFKYKWLKENRPEIIEAVPNKIIASYLNISEVHLSRIKAKLVRE